MAYLSLAARMSAGALHVHAAKATLARVALQLEADLINDVLAVSTSALAALPPPPPRGTVSAPLWPPPLTPPFPPTSAHHAAVHACMFAFPSGRGYECIQLQPGSARAAGRGAELYQAGAQPMVT